MTSLRQRMIDDMQMRWPKASEMLLEADEGILVCKTFSTKYQRSIRTNNSLVRLNQEILRRSR